MTRTTCNQCNVACKHAEVACKRTKQRVLLCAHINLKIKQAHLHRWTPTANTLDVECISHQRKDVHTYTHTCFAGPNTHTITHRRTQTHMHACMHANTQARMHARKHMHACMHACMHANTHIFTHTYHTLYLHVPHVPRTRTTYHVPRTTYHVPHVPRTTHTTFTHTYRTHYLEFTPPSFLI